MCPSYSKKKLRVLLGKFFYLQLWQQVVLLPFDLQRLTVPFFIDLNLLCWLNFCLTLSYMGGGGSKRPPWLIILHLSSGDAPNGLIFHDFVTFNIRKVLGRPFLGFLFEITKKFTSTIFYTYNPKGGPFYFWVLFGVKNGNDSTPNA